MPPKPRYVALLRGINVGGKHTVPMVKLKKAFEAMGFADVSTYINSGNVLFSADKFSEKTGGAGIEKELERLFGFEIKTVIRSAAKIQALCKQLPDKWQNDGVQKTDILFLWTGFDSKASLKLLEIDPKVDTLRYAAGAIAWNIDRKHYNKSGMNNFIGTRLYKHMTARNINTVRKLAELLN